MTIIFFTSCHKIGLTAQAAEQAFSFVEKTRHKFIFISGECEQFPGLFAKFQQRNIEYHVIKGLDEHTDFGKLVKDFKVFIERDTPDYVTVQTNWQLAIVTAAKYLSKVKFKVVYIINGYRANHRYGSIIARGLIFSALFCCVSHVVAPSRFVNRKFQLLGNKIKIIFLGEDEALFEDYSIPLFSGTKRMVFAGEFRVGKNQDMLIRVLRRYIEASGDSDIELYLPGQGERLELCRQLSKKLDIENKVFFPGFLHRKEMHELYRRCQYALVPSSVETFGHCIAEPFILGRVVITRHVGVADDIIEHGENGFFFDSESDLFGLLVQVFSTPAMCGKIARNTRYKRDCFRWNSVCQQYVAQIFET